MSDDKQIQPAYQQNPTVQTEKGFTYAGPSVNIVNVESMTKMYAVSEDRLESLTLLNAFTALFFSAGTGVGVFGVDKWVDYVMLENPSEGQTHSICLVVIISLIVTLFCYAVGGIMWYRRGSILSKIRSGSRLT